MVTPRTILVGPLVSRRSLVGAALRGLLSADRNHSRVWLAAFVALALAIAMDYSHPRFEKESLKAFSKWQFEVTDPDRAKSLSVIQRMGFFIDE